MHALAIRSLDQLTPARLSDILRREGELPRGDVLAVAAAANSAFNSTISHLELSYSPDAPPAAPRRLLLKRNLDAEWAVRAGAREAAFYGLISSLPERPPMIVRCYDAAHDQAGGSSHVLLLDCSATHRPPLTREQQLTPGMNVPTEQHLDAVVDALAGFHARWWGQPALSSGVVRGAEWRATQQGYADEAARRRAVWADLIEHEAGWFPEQFRSVIEAALAGLPRLWQAYLNQRFASPSRLTIVHGDCYFVNFLCPLDADGATYLVDWQSPELGVGADDLVNLMATFWTPEQRADNNRELGALRRYYATLRADGVQNYSWEQLQLDYRLALVEWLFVPIFDRADGSPTDYWWPKLQNLAAAYGEWACAELMH